jgi:hypothetical protein
VNGFIDHLCTRLETTSNYNTTSDLHNSQITPAAAKPFPACCVFTSRSLAATSNGEDSSASRAQVLSSQPPFKLSELKVTVTLQLVVYRQSVRLGTRLLETQDQSFFCFSN